MRRVRRLDRRQRIEWLPLQSEALEVRLPALSRAACERELHLVTTDGRVFRGGGAAAAILRQLGGALFVLGWLAALPPLSWLVGIGYRWVAANRHRFGPADGACSID